MVKRSPSRVQLRKELDRAITVFAEDVISLLRDPITRSRRAYSDDRIHMLFDLSRAVDNYGRPVLDRSDPVAYVAREEALERALFEVADDASLRRHQEELKNLSVVCCQVDRLVVATTDLISHPFGADYPTDAALVERLEMIESTLNMDLTYLGGVRGTPYFKKSTAEVVDAIGGLQASGRIKDALAAKLTLPSPSQPGPRLAL